MRRFQPRLVSSSARRLTSPRRVRLFLAIDISQRDAARVLDDEGLRGVADAQRQPVGRHLFRAPLRLLRRRRPPTIGAVRCPRPTPARPATTGLFRASRADRRRAPEGYLLINDCYVGGKLPDADPTWRLEARPSRHWRASLFARFGLVAGVKDAPLSQQRSFLARKKSICARCAE